jgi:hypothetical protein
LFEFIVSELTSRHLREDRERQQKREEKIKQIVVEVLKEPEMHEIVHGRLALVAGS